MDFIILAAGLGTRIQSVNPNANKCLLTIHGESLLQRKLDAITKYKEIEHIYIVVHKDENKIQRMIGDSYHGISVCYIRQKVENGGLINAIFNVVEEAPIVNDRELFICLGDEFFGNLDVNQIMDSFSHANKEIFALCVPTTEIEKIKNNYSVTTTGNFEIINAIEKPKEVSNALIGTGVLVLQSNHLLKFKEAVEKGNCRGMDLVDLLNSARQLGITPRAYVYETEYFNINTTDDLNQVTQNAINYSEYEYVIDLFKDTVKRYGDRVAVIQEKRTITFQELDQLSDTLCYTIQKRFMVRNKGIGIMCGRTIEHLIAVLGILKAGAYYIPMDEHLPEKRIQYMVQKSDCLFVIGKKELCKEIQLAVPIYEFDTLIQEQCDSNVCYEYKEIKKKSAYIIFTSGSTGQPKGAVLTEKGLLNLVWGMKKEILDKHKSEHLQVGVMASFSFDLSVQQIFSSILLGHTLHIIPYEAKFNANTLIGYLNQVDFSDGTPMIMSMLNQHLLNHPEDNLTLKHYVSAGETLRKSTVHQYFELCPNAWVTNSYGPTECTVETTFFHMNKEIESRYDVIPIGKAIGNMRIYILDQEKKMLPQEEEGEIWIAGTGVGKGYIHDEALSKAAFQTDILNTNQQMYKTGDVGYFSTEGNLCYVGRIDNQIKYKGYRIETGEIEKVFEKHCNIRESRVLLVHDEKADALADSYLVAYLLLEGNQMLGVTELLEYAKAQLPEYMIPQFFVPVEKFEINNSGKLNKEVLPDYKKYSLRDDKGSVDAQVYSQLQSEANFIKLIHIIEELTGKVTNYEQSLISFGLDSLRMYELLIRIAKEFNIQVELKEFQLWMSITELYEKVVSCLQSKNTTSEIDESPVRRTREKGVNSTGLLRYLCELEELNSITGEFEFMNQMIYLIRLKDDIDYERLNQAYRRIQEENDTFQLQIMPRGKNYKVLKGKTEIKDLIKKENCKAVSYVQKDLIHADVSQEILDYFYDELQNISFRNDLYKVLFCTDEGKKMLVVSFHHVIFDYLSLVYFMERLSFYYKNVDENGENSRGAFYDYLVQMNQNEKTGVYEQQSCNMQNTADYVTPYSKENFFQHISQFPSVMDCKVVEIPYAKKSGCKLMGSHIPVEIYNKVEEYSKKYHILKANIYEAVFYYIIRKYSLQENPSYLFYTSGRKELELIQSIGFYSYPLFFEGHKVEWSKEFHEFVKQLQERKLEIENNMICPCFVESDSISALISQELIFDYQKLYNQLEDDIWSVAYPFESSSYSNPLAFRIFDYGKYGDVSIICQDEFAENGDVKRLLTVYWETCKELIIDKG